MSEVASSVGISTSESAYPARAVGWYATLVLAFLYWLSVLDRFIISLLVDPIKRDLGLTDMQFGMLHGLAFVFAFTLFGLVFGVLADRVNRRWVVFVGVSVWSVATALCGVAQNFWHLLVARIGVGAGEASLNPCAASMIADLFPRERLTSAMAAYSLGATVGSGTALIVGGAIVYLVTNMGEPVLPLIGAIRPWQTVFFIVGLPGMLVALTIFTVPEPVRRGQLFQPGTAHDSWRSTYVELFKFIRSRPRFFLCHYAGFTLANTIVTGCSAWYPVHMMRAFGWSAGRVGFLLGLTLMAGGVISKFLCGYCVDTMYRRGYRDAQMRWYAGCLILAAPLGVFATTSGNPCVFLMAIGFFLTLMLSLPPCSLTALNLVTPNQLRGTGVAVFLTVSSLIGGGAGAMLVAWFSEHLFAGEATIGLGMATLIGTCAPLGALILTLGCRAMREAMVEAERARALL
jgi:MFS family permease